MVLASAIAAAQPATLTVTSNAIGPSSVIPVEFTCDGAAHAPTIYWSDVPEGTRSIAILVDNPDALRGPFTHLLVTNLPPTQTSLLLDEVLPAEAHAARNDAGSTGYLAPCPEDGVHRYHFRVFALDEPIKPAPATRVVTRASFLRGIDGHVLAQGVLVGVYEAR